MRNGEKPAFNNALPDKMEYVDKSCYDGLTKREYFAGLAMQGILANPQTVLYRNGYSTENVSVIARQMADKLLKQLENS